MVPAEQTERRNLIMVNPIEGNTYAHHPPSGRRLSVRDGGDKARTHRHTAAALRLVLAGKPGTYTVVDGARIDMAPGDVVLTPAWCWHGHANESDETSYWIDFLDIPFVQLTEAMFFEPYPRAARGDHRERAVADAHSVAARRSGPAATPRPSRSPRT